MTYIANRLAAFLSKDSGSVAPIVGLLFLMLVGVSGVAIDFARATHTRTKMQDALDSAVLAGARANDGQVSAAEKMFNTNFLEKAAKNVTVAFGPTGDGAFSGTATGQLDTTLAGVLGINQLQVGAVSKAKGVGVGGGGGVCILVLDKTAAQAFLVNSGPEVNSTDCELHVKSMGDPAAIFNAGSDIDTKRICISGKKIIDNGGNHPNLETECIAANDPLAGKLTAPSTTGACSNRTYSGNVTLQPGVYCGGVNFNQGTNVTLRPGTYVIKGGDWNANAGTWSGTGVTFYFADQSKLQFNSAVAANISAPTSGDYKDIVMFEKSGLARSPFIFDDSRSMNLQGVIYLPSRDVIFNSTSHLTNNKKATIIVNTLILNGTHWNLTPGSDEILRDPLKSVHLIR